MILLVLALTLILTTLYGPKTFFYSLMIFFVWFDMFDGFYDDEKIFAAIRYVVPLVAILFFIFKESALKASDLPLFVLSLYLFILLIYSRSDILISFKTLLAVLITLFMIPIGRMIARKGNSILSFERYNRFLLMTLPLYIIAANIFRFGESYSDAFTTGYLITSRMYVIPIVVFLAIYYLLVRKDQAFVIKVSDMFFIGLNICIILINTRRTAIGMLFMALLIYGFLNRNLIFKMIILGLVLVTVLVVSYPLYEKPLTAQLEKRQRIQELDTYEEEGRYLETLYIMDHHSRSQKISEIAFGVKLFDTYEFGTKYFGRDRPIHSDINMIFYSTGFVGIILFAWVFIHYFFVRNEGLDKKTKSVYYPMLIMFMIVLIPGRFIGTLTYAPLLMFVLSFVKASQTRVPKFSGFHVLQGDPMVFDSSSMHRSREL